MMLTSKNNFLLSTGYLVLIFLTCCIAFITVLSINKINARITKFDIANKIENKIYELRKIEAEYARTGMDKYKDEVFITIKEIDKIRISLDSKITLTKHKDFIKEIAISIENYKKHFVGYSKYLIAQENTDNQMVQIARNLDALVNNFRHELELSNEPNKISKINNINELVIDYLQARRHEKNFILRQDMSYIEKVSANIVLMEEQCNILLRSLSNRSLIQQIPAISEAIKQYKDIISLYITIGAQKTESEKEMLKSAINSQNLARQIALEQKNLMNRSMKIAQLVVLLISGITIVFCIMLMKKLE